MTPPPPPDEYGDPARVTLIPCYMSNWMKLSAQKGKRTTEVFRRIRITAASTVLFPNAPVCSLGPYFGSSISARILRTFVTARRKASDRPATPTTAVMPPRKVLRRPHRKSRLGCQECKRRHVKVLPVSDLHFSYRH